MKTADIRTDGTKYRQQGSPYPVTARKTGVKRYSFNTRKDGVEVVVAEGPDAGRVRVLYSKEIIREWNADDEATLARTRQAHTATSRARLLMAKAGFQNPTVRVSVREHNGQTVEIPHIGLNGDDADKLLALLDREVEE